MEREKWIWVNDTNAIRLSDVQSVEIQSHRIMHVSRCDETFWRVVFHIDHRFWSAGPFITEEEAREFANRMLE